MRYTCNTCQLVFDGLGLEKCPGCGNVLSQGCSHFIQAPLPVGYQFDKKKELLRSIKGLGFVVIFIILFALAIFLIFCAIEVYKQIIGYV